MDLSPIQENGDVYSVWSNDGKSTLLVADGVSRRVETTKLQQLITAQDNRATPTSYSAQFLRDFVETKISNNKLPSLQSLLLEANAALRKQLEVVYGELTAEALLQAEPQLHFLKDDPRLIRLVLPSCVATIARVDLVTNTLEFAHAGDTALFLFYRDGNAVQITDDQMGKHDKKVLELAKTIQDEKGCRFSEALSDDRVIEMNRRNGIYHNYVDQYGHVDTKAGVGVVNGLPQFAAYIQQGTLDLNNVASLLICSDGLIWPAFWNENNIDTVKRLRTMRELIERLNLSGYVAELRNVEKADATHDRYPRIKTHDNATGIFLELF